MNPTSSPVNRPSHGLDPTPGPTALTPEHLQAWIARRSNFRNRVKAIIASLLIVVVSGVAIVWTLFHEQFVTMGRLDGANLTTTWDINLGNFQHGGVTSVAYSPHWFSASRAVIPADLMLIPKLLHVRSLDLSFMETLKDSDLAVLADLPELNELMINHALAFGYLRDDMRPPLTDRALDHIAGLKHLQILNIAENRITDAGLAKLANLTELESLDLDGTLVTDKGLAALKGLTKLKFLRVEDTRVTREGVATFQRWLPQVEVSREKMNFAPIER